MIINNKKIEIYKKYVMITILYNYMHLKKKYYKIPVTSFIMFNNYSKQRRWHMIYVKTIIIQKVPNENI